MGLEVDYYNSIVKITSPTVLVAGQDLHDFIEDSMASPEGLCYSAIMNPEGKIEDPTNPGIYTVIIIQLNSPWQIQFWQGSGFTKIYGAKIIGGLNNQPIKATGYAGDITVLESPIDGVVVGSSGGNSSEEIADAILDELISEHHQPGSLGKHIKDIKTGVGNLPGIIISK